MGEALLRAHLHERGASCVVHSAGTMSWDASPPGEAMTVMEEMGLDISEHRARPLSVDLIEGADLILGMTRDHVGRVVALVPDAWERTFLVRELVRLAERVGPRQERETPAEYVRLVGAGRPEVRVPGRAGDEVDDPYGEPVYAYRATATRLDAELRELAALLAP